MHHHADVFIHFKVVKSEFLTVELLNLKNQATLYLNL